MHRLALDAPERPTADGPLLERPVPNRRHAPRKRPEHCLGVRIPDDRAGRPGHVSPSMAMTARPARWGTDRRPYSRAARDMITSIMSSTRSSSSGPPE
jgi:hypothetical protein